MRVLLARGSGADCGDGILLCISLNPSTDVLVILLKDFNFAGCMYR